MKSHLILTVILFLILVFFPLIGLADNSADEDKTSEVQSATEKEPETTTQETETTASETVSLTVSATGKVTEMSVEEYVYGVVCAEMPASFHTEALKAQAVACYTYLKWLKENADNSDEGDITDSASVHQAYITEDELRERWGTSYDIYSEKVKNAVESVLFEFLTYKGETAMTVFHGLSPGRTVSASQIWKTDVPYLKSVTAPGDSLSPDITEEITLTEKDFVKPFKTADEKDADSIFKSIKENENGFVSEISFGKDTLSPTDLRSAYGLKSPHFKAEKTEKGILLTVYGKGHGVGMSQYSADYMARQGSTYKEILAHFYEGTVLKK